MKFVDPQLAHRGKGFAESLLNDTNYVAEEKKDGERCLAGGTRVLTRRAYKPVNRIVEGEEVLTASGEFKLVTAVVRRARNAEDVLVDVLPWHGLKMRLTSGHRCLTATGWKRAGELTDGDQLVLPRPKRLVDRAPRHIELTVGRGYTKRVRLTTEFCWFLGLWVGDGSATVRSGKGWGLVRVTANRHDDAVVKRAAKTFERIGLDAHFNHGRGTTIVSTYDSGLAQFLNDNFIDREKSLDHVPRRGHGKTIPEWFDGLSDRQFTAFITGWRAADGYARTIDTVSEFLVARVYRQMLLRGWQASLREWPTSWTYRGERKRGRAFRLTLMTGNGRGNARARLVYQGDRILVPVRGVARIPSYSAQGDRYLYDLEVAEAGNFVAATVVHNCQVHVQNHQSSAVYSRTGRKFESAGLQWLYAHRWNVANAVLDGELWAPGAIASDVAHLLSSGGEVFLAVFDVLEVGGVSVMERPYRSRRTMAEKICAGEPHAKIRPTRFATNARQLLEAIERESGEGIILKHVESVYKPGSRTRAWVKLHSRKRDKRYCVVVTGVTDKATYSRDDFKTGAVVWTYGVWDEKAQKLRTVGQIGRPGPERERSCHVGRVVECQAKLMFPSGGLRHAKVIGFRDDIPVTQCTVGQ